MTRVGILAAVLVAGCSASPSNDAATATHVDRAEVCNQIAALGGREIWIDSPTLLTPTLIPGSVVVSDLLYSGDSGLPCDGTHCCLLVPYFYAVECNGFSIALVPADRLDGSDEIDAAVVTETLECGGNTDGSATGGLRCRPDCNRADYPSPTGRDVIAVRGRLPTEASARATSQRGRTTYVMTVHEVRLTPTAVDAGPSDAFRPIDPSCGPTPRIGCPCDGFVFADCLVCEGGLWQPVVDCHGIG